MILSNALNTLKYAIPLTLVLAFGGQIGTYEGNIWPVSTNYRLVSATKIDDLHTGFLFTAEKKRDCLFQDLQMYVQQPNDYWVRAFVTFPEEGGAARPASRPVGKYINYWIVTTSSWTPGHPIKIVVQASCWLPFMWNTVTTNTFDQTTILK